MNIDVKYRIVDNRIILEKCPKILTRKIINYILEDVGEFVSVDLCEGIEVIGENAFRGLLLNEIIFPSTLKEIDKDAFFYCRKIKSIIFPSSLVSVGNNAFQYCDDLEYVIFEEGVRELGKYVFSNCCKLKHVKLPNSLKVIGDSAFECCYELRKICIPEGVEKVGEYLFVFDFALENVVLPTTLKKISHCMFEYCYNLSSISIPQGITCIESYAFQSCSKLKNIHLPQSLKVIETQAFSEIKDLEEFVIPEGVEIIEQRAISDCFNIRKITLPSTLYRVENDAFCDNCITCDCILNGKDKTIKFNSGDVLDNVYDKLFVNDYNREKYWFYDKDGYVEFDWEFYNCNDKVKELIYSEKIDDCYFIGLYKWMKKKFIPHQEVIKNMPLEEIDNFFINNNCKVWGKLLELANIVEEENIGSFFKLCYVLGIFNNKVSIRNKAYKFITEKILDKMNEYEIHEKFDNFELAGYKDAFSKFFMTYFDGMKFLRIIDEDGSEVDLLAASYNNFDNVKNVYPNKTLKTNRVCDKLLPEHVINAVRSISYLNIDENNEDLALYVGKYGYTQEQFNEIQKLFNIGKKVECKLFICDDEDEVINYHLLRKDNPLGVVLGNITNCCQVIGGSGESCVKYGITKSNSKFMTFNYNNTIIGQSWVWYDEISNTICLDNIEIPHRYCDFLQDNKKLQNEFIQCLKRMCNNFKKEMNRNGFIVDFVTVGKGFNDLNYVLDKYFYIKKRSSMLSDYEGYTDAKVQYEIK